MVSFPMHKFMTGTPALNFHLLTTRSCTKNGIRSRCETLYPLVRRTASPLICNQISFPSVRTPWFASLMEVRRVSGQSYRSPLLIDHLCRGFLIPETIAGPIISCEKTFVHIFVMAISVVMIVQSRYSRCEFENE